VIRHVWSVLCTKSSIDSDTNNISLFEILEQIQVSQFPEPAGDAITVVPMPVELVSLWTREPVGEPQQGECRLTMYSPRGKSLSSPPQVMDLSKYRRFRSRFQIPGLPLDGPGLCEVEVQFRGGSEAEWNTVARVPIEVNQGIPAS